MDPEETVTKAGTGVGAGFRIWEGRPQRQGD